MREFNACKGKANRFAPFQIGAGFAAIGHARLASGMAAREGEDLRDFSAANSQARRATPNSSLEFPVDLMCHDYGQHILWAECCKNDAGAGPQIDDALVILKLTCLTRRPESDSC